MFNINDDVIIGNVYRTPENSLYRAENSFNELEQEFLKFSQNFLLNGYSNGRIITDRDFMEVVNDNHSPFDNIVNYANMLPQYDICTFEIVWTL